MNEIRLLGGMLDRVAVAVTTKPEDDKISTTPEASSGSEAGYWKPAGSDLVPGNIFCPEAIAEFIKNPRSSSLASDVRMHLSHLGWKIEYSKQTGIRFRYTSPDNRFRYLSLRKLCQDLVERMMTKEEESSEPESVDGICPAPSGHDPDQVQVTYSCQGSGPEPERFVSTCPAPSGPDPGMVHETSTYQGPHPRNCPASPGNDGNDSRTVQVTCNCQGSGPEPERDGNDSRTVQVTCNCQSSGLEPERVAENCAAHPGNDSVTTQVTTNCRDSGTEPDVLVVEKEYSPRAVFDWFAYETSEGPRGKNVGAAELIMRAKRHLSYMGWVLWYADKGGKKELRYTSPSGVCYYSLRTACRGCIEEGVGAPMPAVQADLRKRKTREDVPS